MTKPDKVVKRAVPLDVRGDFPGAIIVIVAVLLLLSLVGVDLGANFLLTPAPAVLTTVTPSAPTPAKPPQRDQFARKKVKDLPLVLLGLHMLSGVTRGRP